VSDTLVELIRAMSDPDIYPERPESVQVVQTHISAVFLAGDLVYKIKKPVNFGFLDFTSLEKRKFFCNQEVVLNSRFSEGIYLGVVGIYRGPTGINLIGEGEEIECAVLMKRVPPECLMLELLRQDRVTPELLDRLADRIAYFHSLAVRGREIDAYGSPQIIRHNLTENFEQTRPYISRSISRRVFDETLDLSMKFLDENHDLIEKRVREGHIRDCHGDLHVDHVIVLERIMLYDCIEFNDRFRYSDTASDLAFLLTDLDYRGYPAFSEHVARRYSVASGDDDILRLLGFYKSYRAFVRGKVIGFTLDEPEISESEKQSAIESAGEYFKLSLACLKAEPSPFLIITCGLMGSGKSFLAEKLGKRLGMEPLRSDVVRKRIYGLSPGEHQLDKYGEGFYTSGASGRTYEALLAWAERSLRRGESVIVDASFARHHDRSNAREMATKAGARFRILHCAAPDQVIRRRLAERIRKPDEPSDGRWEIFPQQKAEFEPIQTNELKHCRTWDSTTEADAFLTEFVRELIFH
jgi:uncharacterized protein